MKTISDYTISCTEAQTRKALELGAPIDKSEWSGFSRLIEPTAEQMIGWLEEQGINISVLAHELHGNFRFTYYLGDNKYSTISFSTNKEAILAAIDAALEYLTDNKKYE